MVVINITRGIVQQRQESSQSICNIGESYPYATVEKLKAQTDVTDKTKNSNMDTGYFLSYNSFICIRYCYHELIIYIHIAIFSSLWSVM